MNAIGGYFELELRQGEHYHKNALRLNSARNCFEYILLAREYKKVYIPYYTCEVLLQPLQRHGISYEFYSINELLEPKEVIQLLPDEAYLYTNYFGLKQYCIERLAAIYRTQLIVDNAQAFFAPRIESIDTFYSPRKFWGVPDGGYLYTDCIINQELLQDKSYMRMQHLLQRIDENAEKGYSSFRKNDDALDNQPMRWMSKLTERLLCNIDYDFSERRRRDNYLFLHKYLKGTNQLNIELQSGEVPMAYLYMTDDTSLKQSLISNRIFVATYWENVKEWVDKDSIEMGLVNNCLALPIDQRYGEMDMNVIVTNVLK